MAESSGAEATAPDDEMASIRAQESIDLQECDAGTECGLLFVPLDYNDPASGELAIAVLVNRATSPQDRIGYLLVNPGGPGGSGHGDGLRSGVR